MTVWQHLESPWSDCQVTDEEEIKEMVNNGKATFTLALTLPQTAFT